MYLVILVIFSVLCTIDNWCNWKYLSDEEWGIWYITASFQVSSRWLSPCNNRTTCKVDLNVSKSASEVSNDESKAFLELAKNQRWEPFFKVYI